MEILGAVAGGAVSNLVQLVSNKAGSSALELLGASSELKNSVEKLERTLKSLQDILAKTEQQPSWLTDLKDAVYEAEGVLDELEYERLKRQVTRFNRPFIFIQQSFLGRVRNIQAKLADILDSATQIEVLREKLEKRSGQEADCFKPRETSSLPNSDQLIGRAIEKDAIMKWLLESPTSSEASSTKAPNDTPVLPIWGMGGIGKTTLVQHVLDDDRVSAHFELRAWVYVSQQFNAKSIIKRILESSCHTKESRAGNSFKRLEKRAGGSFKPNMPDNKSDRGDNISLDALEKDLIDNLKGKLFLIILDDVWNDDEEIWNKLYKCFRLGKQGSKILVTCRRKDIAEFMAKPNKESIKLDGLANVDLWLLFKEHALMGSTSSTENLHGFEIIGREIVAKLSGSPLAAKTIGRILKSKFEIGHWSEVARSELWVQKQFETDIMPALLLSYQYLPNYLKPCFTYLSSIPKGGVFIKLYLIQRWIALDFVQENDSREHPYYVARKYIDELVNYSLIEETNSSQGVHMLKMHDLIHDLATMASKDDIFMWDDTLKVIPKKVRHLSIFFDASQINWSKIISHLDIKSLCSLTISGHRSATIVQSDVEVFYRFLEKVFKEGISLKLLDVVYFPITRIPDSISNLKLLRYLSFGRNMIATLTKSLGCLYHLQALDVSECHKLEKLPKMMKRLINLSYFEGKHELLPITCFRRLIFTGNIPIKVSCDRGVSMKDLCRLTEMHSLIIDALDCINSKEEAMEAHLKEKTSLHNLELSWSSDASLSSSAGKHEQVLEGLQTSSQLRYLKIENYRGSECPEWVARHHLPNLQHIHFEECPMLTKIPILRNFQESMQVIILHECEQLQGAPLLENDDFFPASLKVLAISQCGDFGNSVQSKHLVHLKHLTELKLDGCASIEYLPTKTLHSLTGIYLWECNMLSIEEGTGGLQAFTLLEMLLVIDCPKLFEAMAANSVALPPSLNDLLIGMYPKESLFPFRVRRLDLLFSETLQSVPGEVLCSVNRLAMHGCPNLYPPKESNRQLGPMVGSNIQQLTITDTNTSNLNAWLHYFKSSKLTKLKIEDIPELQSLATDEFEGLFADMQSLACLSLKNLENLHSLPQTLHKHPSFGSLKIDSCPNITSLSANMFRDDTYLQITSCPKLLRRLSVKEFFEIGPSCYLVKHAITEKKKI